jgi:SAM-dependent methyltransferase
MPSSQPQRAPASSRPPEQELSRLHRQAQLFAPFTRQLCLQAGITPGMRALNFACGNGDVAFLLSELVGTSGEIIGVDPVHSSVQWAIARARSTSLNNVSFLHGDPAGLSFDPPFHAAVGHLALMDSPDPVASLRNLVRHLLPRGLLILQEFDFSSSRSHPPASLFDSAVGWIKQALLASGASPQLGLELNQIFLAAGLPAPALRADSLIGAQPNSPVYSLVADLLHILLPTIEKFHIATPADLDLPTLPERMAREVLALRGVVLSPALIGAWSRKSS